MADTFKRTMNIKSWAWSVKGLKREEKKILRRIARKALKNDLENYYGKGYGW